MNLAKKAEPLINLFVTKAHEIFGTRVSAIFKIGSLGSHGDFSACSDVDVALFLDTIKNSDHAEIAQIQHDIQASGLDYADRLSIFWSCYDNTVFSHGVARFPALDRLDLLEYGMLLNGEDHRNNLSYPTHEQIVLESAAFIIDFMLAATKFDELIDHPQQIGQKGARYFSKFVLFPARLIMTLDQPGKIGANKDAVEHFKSALQEKLPKALSTRQNA